MKKFLILCAFCFTLSALAYSSDDLSNANYLGDQNIITKQTTASKYALDNKILRQEVIGMALKIKGITLPEKYSCKKYFTDATKNDWVCRAVELAADNGIITRSNKYANPGKYVTRAEALSMMMRAGGITLEQIPMEYTLSSSFGTDFIYTYDEYGSWQANVFYTYLIRGGFKDLELNYTRCAEAPCKIDLRFNDNALRSEVFWFTRNIKVGLLPIESREKNMCTRDIDCSYIWFTGECSTPEYISKTQKEAQDKGINIGEAPPRDNVTCTCEANKCITHN